MYGDDVVARDPVTLFASVRLDTHTSRTVYDVPPECFLFIFIFVYEFARARVSFAAPGTRP